MLLNVNINYLANLRNSIGGGEPDILKCARYCEHSGADGIIAHIGDKFSGINTYDIKNLKHHLKTKFILKMAMNDENKQLALDCTPDIVCIVPDSDEPSPSKGFNALKFQSQLKEFMEPIIYEGSVPSLFIEPEIDQVNSAYKAGMNYIELNTKNYTEAFKIGNFDKEFLNLKECTVLAHTLGMKVGFGKSLDYQNASKLSEIPWANELSIGHSITTKAIFMGLDSAIKEMKELINNEK